MGLPVESYFKTSDTPKAMGWFTGGGGLYTAHMALTVSGKQPEIS